MKKQKYSEEEKQFLIDNYAQKSSVQLSKIWFETFGVERTPQALRCLAKRICKGFELNRVGRGIRRCKGCDKKFYADNNKVYHNVRFCSPKCYGNYLTRKNEKRLMLSSVDYTKIFKRDKDYIENSFYLFAKDNNVSFEDLIDFFYSYQFKYYVYFCVKHDKRIKLNRFLYYALLHVLRENNRETKLLNKYKDNLEFDKNSLIV